MPMQRMMSRTFARCRLNSICECRRRVTASNRRGRTLRGGVNTVKQLGLLLVAVALSLHVAAAEWQSTPIDTSSPRATLQSFLAMTDEYGRRYIDYRDSPSQATQNALLYTQTKSLRLLDLSLIEINPEAVRTRVPGLRAMMAPNGQNTPVRDAINHGSRRSC